MAEIRDKMGHESKQVQKILEICQKYYRYPLLRLDLTFGSRRNSAPISLDFCKHTLVVSTYMFRVFFPAENDAEDR